MHPRKNIIEIFSTFLLFAGDRFGGWATDARLRRSIKNSIAQTPQEMQENFWVLFWYNHWQNLQGKIAKEHLIAYLQEACYWTAQRTVVSFVSSQYKLSDCFQIAITSVDKVLKGFKPNQGHNLKNYAGVIFGTAIRETLRQRQEVDICTDWGMLRKISQKRMIEALQASGLSTDTISAYVTAWNCFRSIYIPTQANSTRQLSRPDDRTWDAITQAYNTQTHQQIVAKTLESWLQNCAKAARSYLYPNLTSINTPNGSDDSTDWLENIPANEQDSLLNEIITQEEQQTRAERQSEINQLLKAAVSQLEPPAQEILRLYYVEKLTQQQIAKQLQIQQYTVSRRLTKTRESLLRMLAKWSQDNLHISVTSDILKSTSAVMEEWLQAHYNSSSLPEERRKDPGE